MPYPSCVIKEPDLNETINPLLYVIVFPDTLAEYVTNAGTPDSADAPPIPLKIPFPVPVSVITADPTAPTNRKAM